MGKFQVGANDPCKSWVTLTFEKSGFDPLEVQHKGQPKDPVELCMTAIVGP